MAEVVQRLLRGLRGAGRVVSWHRRLVAAVLAALGVTVGLSTLEPEPSPTSRVVTIARDLPAGTRLAAEDVRLAALPAGAVPDGALRSRTAAAGRVLAAPARRGEPLTDVRLLGPSLASAYGADRVVVPVRVSDAGVLELVRVGSRVDVLAAELTPEQAFGPARALVRAAPVVALPARAREEEAGAPFASPIEAGDGGLLLLAVPPAAAPELARAAVTARLSLVIRR